MGLDIYVGPLTRYYAGDWETIVQRTAREMEIKAEIIRAIPDPPDKITDKSEINQAVRLWMSAISTALAKNISTPLDWDERGEAPYFTDKPGWVGYAGLLLLAAHRENLALPMPEIATTRWDNDPAYQSSTAEGFHSRFGQILLPEYWLPVDFPFVFNAEDVVGNKVAFGSSPALLRQLISLNDETFRGTENDLAKWIYDGATEGDQFQKSAQFGIAMFARHAKLSVEHRLPMKLDY